jgi:hypothetical protein
MKAKKIISEKTEQPNPLPTPSDQERREALPLWQKEIIALAEARLSVEDVHSVVSDMLRRAIGMSMIVEDLALSEHESELPSKALAKVMQIIQEDIHVAKWIATGRMLYPEEF